MPPATAARPVAFDVAIPEKELKNPMMSGTDGVQARTMPQMNHVLFRSRLRSSSIRAERFSQGQTRFAAWYHLPWLILSGLLVIVLAGLCLLFRRAARQLEAAYAGLPACCAGTLASERVVLIHVPERAVIRGVDI